MLQWGLGDNWGNGCFGGLSSVHLTDITVLDDKFDVFLGWAAIQKRNTSCGLVDTYSSVSFKYKQSKQNPKCMLKEGLLTCMR